MFKSLTQVNFCGVGQVFNFILLYVTIIFPMSFIEEIILSLEYSGVSILFHWSMLSIFMSVPSCFYYYFFVA